MITLLFMNTRPILGHFLFIFYSFSSKLPEIAKFRQNCDFWSSGYISTFMVQNSVRVTFNFRSILADFYDYALNMTSYHVTEANNDFFSNWNLKFIHKPIHVPNLVKEFIVEAGFLQGAKSPPPGQLKPKITPPKTGLIPHFWPILANFKTLLTV